MELKYFKKPTPKYKGNSISELIGLLEKTDKPREKVPILINISLINQNNFRNELLDCLLMEVADKLNIQTREFGTLTVSMVAAITIIQLNISNGTDLRKAIYGNWSEQQISDFYHILNSEGFDIDYWFRNQQ